MVICLTVKGIYCSSVLAKNRYISGVKSRSKIYHVDPFTGDLGNKLLVGTISELHRRYIDDSQRHWPFLCLAMTRSYSDVR